MLLSMTGYGNATECFKTSRGSLEVTAEIKTVNSKFLDLSIRSPRAYIQFDSEIGKLVRAKLKRGRVDVGLTARLTEGTSKEFNINRAQVGQIHAMFEKLRDELHLKDPIRLSDLLKLPDWIESRDAAINLEEEWNCVNKVVAAAILQVIESRTNEGRSLQQAIENHRDRFGEVLEKIARSHDSLLANLRVRTRERVASLFGNDGFDPHRLEQEIVLWVARSDFQEELDRIRHHLETFDEIVDTEGEVGRKFEFLVQELHREVNTLGSKCPDAAVTPLVIELKTCIERIREQIQNIE
jgi:uncharacterized protein (TIGR00255 family)